MNLFKTALLITFALSTFCTIDAQTLTEKQKQREKDKVEIYSSEEKDRLQMWFHEETKKLNLSEEEYNKYTAIIANSAFKMRRLNDKDRGLSNDEISTEFKKLVDQTNGEVKKVLTKEQYEMHLKNFTKLADGALKKQQKQKH